MLEEKCRARTQRRKDIQADRDIEIDRERQKKGERYRKRGREVRQKLDREEKKCVCVRVCVGGYNKTARSI